MMEDIKLVATLKCTHEEHQAFKYCPFTPLQKLRRIFDDCYRFGGTGVAGANMVIEDIITPTVAAATQAAAERAEIVGASREWLLIAKEANLGAYRAPSKNTTYARLPITFANSRIKRLAELTAPERGEHGKGL